MSPNRSLRVGLMILACVPLVAACGVSGGAKGGLEASPLAPPSGASSGLSLQRLSSLTNYRSLMSSGTGEYRLNTVNSVHSPSNWESSSGLTVLHINGMGYVHVGDRWIAQKDRVDAYARNNLPSFARQFWGMTRVPAASLRRGNTCRQAGIEGHVWTVSAGSGAILHEWFSACIADAGGALLKLIVDGRGAALSARDAREIYEITAVGSVPPFTVPATLTRN